MTRRFLTAVALAVLAGCSGYSPTSPSAGAGSAGGAPGGQTGGYGGGTTGPAPLETAVIVGNNFFKSAHNGTVNTAVDTVAVGGTVTWTWTNTANVPHSVESIGSPIFRNSTILTGDGSTYQITFNDPGTYEYECAVHGAMMTGKIVVR